MKLKESQKMKLLNTSKKHQDLINKILEIEDGLDFVKPDYKYYFGIEGDLETSYSIFESTIGLLEKIIFNSTVIIDADLNEKSHIIKDSIWQVNVTENVVSVEDVFVFVGTESSVTEKLKGFLAEASALPKKKVKKKVKK